MQRDDPYSLRPFVEKGIIYYELKMYGEAVQNFKDALRLDSDNVHALYNLGLAYEMNNQRDKALESYSLARQKNGSFTKAFERFSALEGNLADEYLISARRAYEKEEWQRCLEIVEKSMALTLPGTQKYKELKKMKTLATTRVSVGKNRQKSIRNAFSAERKKYDEVVVRGQLRYRDIDLIWTGVVFKKFEEKGETILQVMYATDSTTLVNTTDRNCFAQMYQIHCGKILPKDRRIDEDSFVEVYGRVIGTESMIEGYRYGCTEQIPVVRAFRLTLTNQTTSGPLVIEPLN
jgi:hypothetical protein